MNLDSRDSEFKELEITENEEDIETGKGKFCDLSKVNDTKTYGIDTRHKIIMTFMIGNINCSGCTNNIEKNIREAYDNEGLISVVATLLTHKLEVKVLYGAKDHITHLKIKHLVESLGKTCEFESVEEVKGSEYEIRKSTKKYFSSNLVGIKEPIVKEFHLNVYGMSCTSCEGNLTRKISALDGVIEATFSVLTKQAKIIIDINKISIREIIDNITFGKFSATLKEKNNKIDIREIIRIESIRQK